LGQELLKEWALKRQEKALEKAKETHPKAKNHEKKKLYWQTTFGKIEIEETIIKVVNERLWPFSSSAQVKCRSYSYEELKPKLRGWISYFRYTEVDNALKELDSWIRRKLRKIIWKQMKLPRKRAKEMIKRGVAEDMARKRRAVIKEPGEMP
jgi:hypothetical protein